MNEKSYLFNPFNIKQIEDNELAKIYEDVMKELFDDPNSMYEYSHNIEVYSNLIYIVGEMIARRECDVIKAKTKIEINKAKVITQKRQEWNKEEQGKAPAMSYFEALGTEYCLKDINTLAELESSLRRFKNAYSSMQEKINALKKKQESIKYEEFNQ